MTVGRGVLKVSVPGCKTLSMGYSEKGYVLEHIVLVSITPTGVHTMTNLGIMYLVLVKMCTGWGDEAIR